MKRRSRARGAIASKLRAAMTLIETTIVLIIAVAAMAAGASIYSNYLQNQTNRVTADQLRQVSTAYGRFLMDRYGETMARAQSDGGVTEVLVSELVDLGYLDSTFQNRNAYNQEFHLMARHIPATGPGGEDDRLETIVYTSSGESISPNNALDIAKMVGAGGGFTPVAGDTSQVHSTFDGYSLDLDSAYGINPGPGKLVSAMFFNDTGSLVSDFLYRNAVPGRPDLNRMNTSIDMGVNDLFNARALNAQTLTTSGDARVGGTTQLDGAASIGGAASPGQALTVNGNLHTTGSGAVDGALSVGGTLSATNITTGGVTSSGWYRSEGATGWYSDTYAGGWYMQDPTWIRSYNDKSIYTGGTVLAGTVTGGVVQSNASAAPGAACTGGTIGVWGSDTMVCSAGVWKKSGADLGITTGVVSHGQTIPLPAGYSDAQCTAFVSVNHSNPSYVAWDISEDGAYVHDVRTCSVSGRLVSCQGFVDSNVLAMQANYLMLCKG